MKNLILILLLSVTLACKKKDVNPTPQPDPVPTTTTGTTTGNTDCKSDLKVFAGRWKDSNNNYFDILWVKNYCPDVSNKNEYTIKNFAAVNNKYNAGHNVGDFDRTAQVIETYAGPNVMKIDGNGDGKLTVFTITNDDKTKMSIVFPFGKAEFHR